MNPKTSFVSFKSLEVISLRETDRDITQLARVTFSGCDDYVAALSLELDPLVQPRDVARYLKSLGCDAVAHSERHLTQTVERLQREVYGRLLLVRNGPASRP